MSDAMRGMTERDLRWLKALAEGSEIKELEGGSESVIKNRLTRLRRRFGCRTTMQLVCQALKDGTIK